MDWHRFGNVLAPFSVLSRKRKLPVFSEVAKASCLKSRTYSLFILFAVTVRQGEANVRRTRFDVCP